MPGLTPDAAFHDFLGPIQRAVRCLNAGSRLSYKGHPDKVYVVAPGDGVRFVQGNATYRMDNWFNVRAIPHKEGWRVTTEQYIHEVVNHNDERIAAWHWHPNAPRSPVKFTHLHVAKSSPFSTLHYPTNRVSIEEVVRFVIEEMGAAPATPSWEQTLRNSEDLHRQYQSW